MRRSKALVAFAATCATGFTADASAQAHRGWCIGVGNPHRTAGCIAVPAGAATGTGTTPTGIVNSVPANPQGGSTYAIPIPIKQKAPHSAIVAVPQPILPPQNSPKPVYTTPRAPTQMTPPQQPVPVAIPPRVPPLTVTGQQAPAQMAPPQQPVPVAIPPRVPPLTVTGQQAPAQMAPPQQPVPVAIPPRVPPLAIAGQQAPAQMAPPQQPVPVAIPPRVPPLTVTGQQAPAQMAPPQQPVPVAIPPRVPPLTVTGQQAPANALQTSTSAAKTGTFSNLQTFVVPHAGEQPAGSLYRQQEEHAQLGHNECVVSGLGRRRGLHDTEGRFVTGLFYGFRLTDALTRDLPLNRHIYSGCFMAVRRLWHDHD